MQAQLSVYSQHQPFNTAKDLAPRRKQGDYASGSESIKLNSLLSLVIIVLTSRIILNLTQWHTYGDVVCTGYWLDVCHFCVTRQS